MTKYKRIEVGDKFTAKCGTELTVAESIDCNNIILSDQDANTRVIDAASLRSRTIAWRNVDGSLRASFRQPKKKVNKPRTSRAVRPDDKRVGKKYPYPKGHYVYLATLLGEGVVYVGMGKGARYAHCYSGKSTSKELNRLYFQKAPMLVEVYKDNLSAVDARALERQLIAHYKPRCNIVM